MSKSDRNPRSPLKEIIKRSPGQSADEQIESIRDDYIIPYMGVIITAVSFALFEWWRFVFHIPIQPVFATIIAIIVSAFSIWKIKSHLPAIQQLKLGRDGEREVGQLLSDLAADFKVFHDIPCDGFNIDHALIGRTGVFCVETKTRSKSGGIEEKVVYDGEKILVNGFEPDRDPIIQAKANANMLAKIILQQTGKQVTVTSIVVFPGWWVELRVKNPEVMVLNPKMLPGFVRARTHRLGAEDLAAIAAGLLRHQEHMAKIATTA